MAVTAPMSRLRVALVWHGELMADHLAVAGVPITVGTHAGATFVVPVTTVPDGFAVIRPGDGGWMLATTVGEGAIQLAPIRATDAGVIALADGIELFFQHVTDDTRLPRRRASLDLLTPALAFALLLHGVMVFATYVFDEDISPFAVPGNRRVIGEFLVQRVKAPPEPAHERVVGPATPAASTPSQPPSEPTPPRAGTAPPTSRGAPPKGLYTPRNRAVIEAVINHDMTPALGRFLGLPGRDRDGGGPGLGDNPPGGTRPGPRMGPSGPGGPGGPGPALDVGPIRDRASPGRAPVEAEVELMPPTTDAPSLTRNDIQQIVLASAGRLRACYQRAADQRRDLGGTLTVSFVIGGDGRVTESKIIRARSDLQDAAVESCVLRQINRLQFPARGGGRVTYPFLFSQR